MLDKRILDINKKPKFRYYDRQLYILLGLSCFPFIIPNPIISTGIQPYALMYSIYIIVNFLIKGERISISNRLFTYIGIVTYIALFVAIVSIIKAPLTSITRELSAYLNVFFVPLAYCLLRSKTKVSCEKKTKVFILIWVLVGLLQILVDKELFANLLAFHQTSESRGAFGLATEPSFYGIQMYFFLYLIKFFKNGRTKYYLIVLATALLIVRSLTSLIFVAAFFIDEFMDNERIEKSILYAILGILLMVVVSHLLTTVLAESRLTFLLNRVFDDGVSSLDSDLSTMGRVSRITDSFGEALDHHLLPQGYIEKYGSPWGGALNHMGFFGLVYMVCIPGIITYLYDTTIGKTATFISMVILFSTTVQLSNPMLGIIMGMSLSIHDGHQTL